MTFYQVSLGQLKSAALDRGGGEKKHLLIPYFLSQTFAANNPNLLTTRLAIN